MIAYGMEVDVTETQNFPCRFNTQAPRVESSDGILIVTLTTVHVHFQG